MIRFDCPNCAAQFSVPPAQAGQVLQCGKCKHQMRVPATAPAMPISAGKPPVAELLDNGREREEWFQNWRQRGFARFDSLRRVWWSLCASVTVLTALDFFVSYPQAAVVPQAALAAGSCFVVVACYVSCRALDFLFEPKDYTGDKK